MKSLRKKLKLSQEAFGKHFGVSRESVSSWERGLKQPALSLEQVKVLNELLKSADLKIEDLYEEE